MPEYLWLTLYFSSMTLMVPATHYSIPTDYAHLQKAYNAVSVLDSTATVGMYIEGLTKFEIDEGNRQTPEQQKEKEHVEAIAKKEVYRVTEQITIHDSTGNVIFLGTKFRTPYQWAVLSNYIPNPDFYVTSTTTPLLPINVIKDPGFELNNASWQNINFTTAVSHSGQYSGEISNLSTNTVIPLASQMIGVMDVIPIANYQFDFWTKYENVAASGHGVKVLVDWRDVNDVNIQTDYAMIWGFGTSDWVQISTEIVSPKEAITARIEMGLYHSTGTVWFDDVNLTPLYMTEYFPMANPPDPADYCHFKVYPSSSALVENTFARVKETKEQYRLYRAEPYHFYDRLDYHFIKKKIE